MNHLSLFSGIGGIDIAAHWAGFKTVQFVERDLWGETVRVLGEAQPRWFLEDHKREARQRVGGKKY